MIGCGFSLPVSLEIWIGIIGTLVSRSSPANCFSHSLNVTGGISIGCIRQTDLPASNSLRMASKAFGPIGKNAQYRAAVAIKGDKKKSTFSFLSDGNNVADQPRQRGHHDKGIHPRSAWGGKQCRCMLECPMLTHNPYFPKEFHKGGGKEP